MMKIIDVLPNFKNLKEYQEFLQSLVEAEGNEIARGMDMNDKSKQSKEEEQEIPEGEAPEGEEGPEAPVKDPTAAPGSQINLGYKEIKKQDNPKGVKIEISGKKEKINTSPRASKH